MMQQQTHYPPCRITDLVELKKQGANVTCQATFEILPVEFAYHDNPFRAHIFLCMFNGTVNGEAYSFRKCYCRGCPNNLCPHVSQAVMIANRYLQRDYHRLEQVGIAVDKRLFSLEEMTVKYEDLHEDPDQPMTIHDLIAAAKHDRSINVEPALEWVSAVENFANLFSRNIRIHLTSNIDDFRFPKTVESLLYRIIKELINNTVKHAFASEINLDLTYRNQMLLCTYSDNGIGFNWNKQIESPTRGMGLHNIINRIRSLGGDFSVDAGPDKGFHIRFELQTILRND